VAFFGELGSGNTGNDGSFEVVLDWVRRGAPDAQIFCICTGPEQVTARFGIPAQQMFAERGSDPPLSTLRVLQDIGRKVRYPFGVFRLLRDTDWVIVPGAGVLESSWHRAWMMPYALYGLTLSARLRGTRIALINVGADQAASRLSRWLVVQVARRADYLTLRDQRSEASLHSLGVSVCPAQVHPDLAFALMTPVEQPPRQRCVGVGLMNYFDWRGTQQEKADNGARYEQTMVAFVAWLLDEGYAVRLLTGDIWDDSCLQRVLQAIRARHPDLSPGQLVAEPARDLHELMTQMGDVEVVMAARYHNVITALRLAKPVLALAYAPKARQALEQFGLSPYIHRLDAIDLPRLKEQFRALYVHRAEIRRQLRHKLSDIQCQLQAQEEEFVTNFLLSEAPMGQLGGIRAAPGTMAEHADVGIRLPSV
jgi:polysaccharide pyruvyl transferase WcaK-like protein